MKKSVNAQVVRVQTSLRDESVWPKRFRGMNPTATFINRYTMGVVVAMLAMTGSMLAEDAKVKPYLLTPKTTYDTQPTMCESADGTVWTGYVGYHHPDGDAVMVVSKKDGKWSAPEQVNKTRTQIV